MAISLAAGWRLVHLTDRICELRKDDPVYERITGRPGFVRVRTEPGFDRNQLIDKALKVAEQNDEALSKRAIAQLMPSVVSLANYRRRQAAMAKTFGVPGEEAQRKVYR